MKEEIKAIIFDIGGVLALERPDSEKSAERLKQVEELLPHDLTNKGKINKTKILNTISSKLDISSKGLEEYIIKLYKQNFKLNKRLYSLAIKLKKRRYKIAILSNQWQISNKAMPKILSSIFYPNIISYKTGMCKPNTNIYKFILKKLNIPATNILFIDNLEINLLPARKLGISTILFKNNIQLIKELYKHGVRA